MSKNTYTALMTLQRQKEQGFLSDHDYYAAVCNLICDILNKEGKL